MPDPRELPEALQQLPEQPDDFTISMRMWAVMICGGIACWTVIGALFANWMEWI